MTARERETYYSAVTHVSTSHTLITSPRERIADVPTLQGLGCWRRKGVLLRLLRGLGATGHLAHFPSCLIRTNCELMHTFECKLLINCLCNLILNLTSHFNVYIYSTIHSSYSLLPVASASSIRKFEMWRENVTRRANADMACHQWSFFALLLASLTA